MAEDGVTAMEKTMDVSPLQLETVAQLLRDTGMEGRGKTTVHADALGLVVNRGATTYRVKPNGEIYRREPTWTLIHLALSEGVDRRVGIHSGPVRSDALADRRRMA